MLRHFSGRVRAWMGVLQVIILLVALAAPAAAAPTPPPLTDSQLIDLLRSYSIVRGDDQGNLNLDKPITRAEMITIAIRAINGENEAKLFGSLTPFSDADGHWAKGNITYAWVKKLIQGDGNGSVRPNSQISYAEALTLILRLVGKEPTSGHWPTNVILASADLGLLPPGVTMETIQQPAVRGLIFRSLALATKDVQTAQGKTLMQTYLDVVPPVVKTNAIDSPTKEASVTVEGTAQDAAAVTVNGQPATLTGNRFSAKVDLTIGANTIKVEAVDHAGNTATDTFLLTRQSPVAALEVSGPASLRAGETGTYTVTAKDSAGKSVPLPEVTATVTGNIGTFDAKTGVLTASSTTASGSITFSVGLVTKKIDVNVLGTSSKAAGVRITQVNGGLAVPLSRPMQVEVKAIDVNGQLVTDDNGREITLEAQGTGVTVTEPKQKTKDGVATFTVVGTSPGQITLTAKSAGISTSIVVASFGTTTRVVLRTEYGALYTTGIPNSTRVFAELRDESGNLTPNNTGSDILLTLTQSGAVGDVPDALLTIRRGMSTSTAGGDDGSFVARSIPGQVIISGFLGSAHPYSVDPVQVWISAPAVSVGSRLQILNLNPILTPRGPAAAVQLRVVDNNGVVITNGSHAFRVQVDTSNNEPKTNGLPEGVTLTLGSTSFIPVDTGSAPSGNYVYGRTINGTATLLLSYNKSGIVTLTPVVLGPVGTAYHSDGTVGTADGSGSLIPAAQQILFTGSVSGLRLTVDSGLGRDQSSGALGATTGGYFTLRATVLDQFGGRIPGATNAITLVPANPGSPAPAPDNTSPPTFPNDSRNAVDGVAEFSVAATTTLGCDTYKVTTSGGAIQSSTVELCIRSGVPAAPRIIVARGTSGINNRVMVSDTGMELELAWATTGSDTWVSGVVYQDGAEIYTSNVFDMNSPAPRIVVPRNVLNGGQRTYTVALKNASGISTRSAASSPVTVDYETTAYGFSGAKYDATSGTGHKLTVYGYGVSNSGASLDTSKLVVKDASTGASLNLQGAAWTINPNGAFVIDLSTAPAKQSTLESPQFSGRDVTLEAQSGWYYQTNGATGAAVSAKSVTPMADITGVTFDVVNNRLTILGQGFETGNIDLTKVSIVQGGNSLVLNSTNVQTWARASDTTLLVTLTPTGASTLKNPTLFNGSDVLQAEEGWLSDGNLRNRAVPSGAQAPIPVSAQVNVTSISYVKRTETTPAKLIILGSGFFSGGTSATAGTVNLSALSIKDLSLNQAESLAAAGAQVQIVSDGEIQITIDTADAGVFEATFAGADIYVIGQSGWFDDFQSRGAGAIEERYFRLTIN